jgi:toxin ParE1/3/4
MPRFRLSRPAQADLTRILIASAERWGTEGRRRYAAILSAAMHKAAADPEGPATRDQGNLARGMRSLHLRFARPHNPDDRVRYPVHIIYFRVHRSGDIEIARVLHERMEPSRHISGSYTSE